MKTWASLLGCDFVDSALNSIDEFWKQHVATLKNSIESEWILKKRKQSFSPPQKSKVIKSTPKLTASAAKRRLEEEEKRKANLAQMKEKEEKVIQNKQENLKIKAQMTKLRNEEKRKRIEQIKKKEEEELREKRAKEQSKLEEIEKRIKEKEETRKRDLQKTHEAAKKKQQVFDLRKQQEEEERKARLVKQEEQIKQKKEESERIRIQQDKILKMIAQHNNNLQKGHLVKQPVPLTPCGNQCVTQLPLNGTFSLKKEAVEKRKPMELESYQISPPKPKPKSIPVNYDISDIKSDDDTDDEERPRKLIPSWAKGDALIVALDAQFAKPRRARERQIHEIFPCYDYTIDLVEIFKTNRVVHPKYDKRTSSVVWSSPPCNSTINRSILTGCL
ncbi:inner centromere protein-like [Panonychus citri]|uniref:inner centromere protein-like n=1 Tax=Panonychus citri TaxID=50023 RepID=UPI00230746EF|nr:inner centromere protein-like [Panonychus citri]